MGKICLHCNTGKVCRPRGLCWHCYYDPGVKEQYAVCGPAECGQGRKKQRPGNCADCGDECMIYARGMCKACYVRNRNGVRIHCRMCGCVWGGQGFCPECRNLMANPGTRSDSHDDPDPKGRAERVEYYAALVAAGLRLFEPTPVAEGAA